MKIYHSFWDLGWNKFDDKVYNMHKLSVLTALKSYGNIHLITTPKGKELLGDLPYTSIELYEEALPENLKDAWSLSKIYAYKQICKKNEPFFHIDYDVFLFKRIPEHLESSEVLIQHMEIGKQMVDYYHLHVFFENCVNKYLSNDKILVAYNMGIFGGTNIKAIRFYADEAIKLLTDKENIQSYWTKQGMPIVACTKAVVLEQWYLVCCLDHLGVKASALLTDYEDFDKEASKIGYCHIWGSKRKPAVHELIKNKIKELSYVVGTI